MEEIKKNALMKDLEGYMADDKNRILRHALVNNSLTAIVTSQDNIKDVDFNFDIDIKTMPVTSQKQSGRCWIFAATNLIREMIGAKCTIANFEVSQSYIAFYDRLEKCNYLLEALIAEIDSGYDDRTVAWLLSNGIGDGGQWDMFVAIVDKYGLVPKNVYPETATSSGTRDTNKLINFNISKFASDAKALYEKKGIESVRRLKRALMKKIYYMLISCYGLPPEKFDFEYTDKEGVYHLEKGFDPMSFKEKYLGNRLNDFVSIINAPTKDKPFNKIYNVKYLGNVVGAKPVTHLNVEMKRMKQLIVKQLKDGQITWFGSDVSVYGDRIGGSWDDTRFDYPSAVDMDLKMDKGESLDYHASQMNHAMVITGVALKNNNPTKWKIENSWGGDIAKAGYFIMSASWFDQFVYQAVIDKKYLEPAELKALEGKPIVLKPWDPMGSLAD